MSEQSRKQWDRVCEILDVVEGLPPGEQPDAISKHCGDNAELRVLVLEQLNAAAKTKGILDRSSPEVVLWRDATASELPPKHSPIGPFRILEEIGQGGMGVVYKAEQDHPRRFVALKVIRRNRFSSELIRRFHDEADALGRLQHPGIARIYEVGTAQVHGEEQPFFAMEFIEGEPLTEYASTTKLGIRDRLQLLVKICDAVHYAHLKGVIHRDLKPANILVDDSGQPKVLDFGVARIVDTEADGVSHRTEVGQLVGTLPYMSPEQACGNPKDIDNRSDVYALGVVSYELLSEQLPLDVSGKPISQALKSIQLEEPARLSSIDRRLRGDIETIVGKALEKDPTRRYQSVSEMAADMTRFLESEPITARPASRLYRARKFVKRHRAGVIGVAATFLVLIVGSIVSVLFALDAMRARDAEVERAGQLEEVTEFQAAQLSDIDLVLMGSLLRNDIVASRRAALQKSDISETELERALDELQQSLDGVNFTDLAVQTLDQNIFEQSLAAIDRQFADQPLVQAHLLQSLAVTMRELGLLDRATIPQADSLAIRQRELGDDHEDTLASVNEMATLLWHQGDYSGAGEMWRDLLDRCMRLFGEQHEETATVIGQLGVVHYSLGQFEDAEEHLRKALDIRTRLLGPEDPETIGALNNLGTVLRLLGKLDEAETLLTDALEKYRRVQGNEHPETLAAITNMGALRQDQRRFENAEPLLREVMETSRRVLGNGHPGTLGTINNFGLMLREANRLDEAEPYLREALQGFRAILGELHPDTVVPLNNMVALLRDLKRYEESAEFGREAVALARSARPLSTLSVSRCVTQHGLTLIELKRFEEAESLLLEAHDIHVAEESENDRGLIDSIWNLAYLYDSWNRSDPTPARKNKATEWRSTLPEDVRVEFDRAFSREGTPATSH